MMSTLTDFCRAMEQVVSDLRSMAKRRPGRAALLYQWAAHLDDDRRSLVLLAEASVDDERDPPLTMQPLNVTPEPDTPDID
jgi:hypothetical protein